MLADRQTDTQRETDVQTDKLIAIHRSPIPGQINEAVSVYRSVNTISDVACTTISSMIVSIIDCSGRFSANKS